MRIFDRYSLLRNNDEVNIVPFVEIPKKITDIPAVVYNKNKTRLDILSYDYYGDPGFGWLILQANPEIASIEYEIPDGALLRIPYPLDITLREYNEGIKKKLTL